MPKLQNLSGQIFGLLTVLKRANDIIYTSKTRKSGQKLTAWTCQCQCGNTKTIPGVSLRLGKATSCGCMRKAKRMSKENALLVGKRFGRLVVRERAPDRNEHKYWTCECDCGKRTVVLGYHLKSGSTKSCGCLWKERRLEYGLAIKKSKYRIAKIHSLKHGRRSLAFELSFEEFVRISESPCEYCGEPPSRIQKNKNYYGTWTCNGIDRIDSSIGYVPGNCVPCCLPCNQAKNDRDVKFFLDHSRKIVEHQDSLARAYDRKEGP